MTHRIVCIALLLGVAAATPSVHAQSTQPVDPRVAALADGDSNARRRALDELGADQKLVLDPVLIAALKKAAGDRDPRVAREVAILVGQRIWNAKKQDPAAIALECELATHADRDARYNAVYYGLSTVRPQNEQSIAAMFAAGAMDNDYDSNLHGRIAWGLKGTPPAKIAAACERYWTNEYAAAKPASAWVVYLTYREATGQEPPKPERFAAIKAKADELVAQRKAENAKLLPDLARELKEGDSKRRRAAMDKIYRTPYLFFDMDDAMLDAFTAAADDPEWRVRWEVARMTGNRWVWGAPEQKQHPKAIALALKLRKDPEPQVRHFAVYFGLSTVVDKSDEVIRALLDSAINGNDPSTTGRVAWGLRSVPADRLAPFFQPYFDKGGDDAARASQLFSEITSGNRGQVRFTPATKPATRATSRP